MHYSILTIILLFANYHHYLNHPDLFIPPLPHLNNHPLPHLFPNPLFNLFPNPLLNHSPLRLFIPHLNNPPPLHLFPNPPHLSNLNSPPPHLSLPIHCLLYPCTLPPSHNCPCPCVYWCISCDHN